MDKQFGSKADRIYCGPCYDAQFATRCDGCSDVFRAGMHVNIINTRRDEVRFLCSGKLTIQLGLTMGKLPILGEITFLVG